MQGMGKMYLTLSPKVVNKLKKEKWILDELKRRTKVKITLEEGGRVILEPTEGSSSIDMMKAKEVLMALNYGFEPDVAFLLFNDDYVMEVIDVKDLLLDHHDTRELRRVLGRVIGKEGKAKKNIERIAHVYVSISEGTVAIIGEYENVEAAKEAIGELIEGKLHAAVYKRLEMRMRTIKRKTMLDYWEKGF